MAAVIGIVSGILAFATTPLFVANTAVGLNAQMPKEPGVGARIW